MIRDAELIMSGTTVAGADVGQRISSSGTTASTDYIDTLAAGDALKAGARLRIVATELFAGTGTTITCDLECHEDSSFSSGTIKLFSTGAIAKAATVAGTVLADVVIPTGCEQYLRMLYTADNTFETTGKVSATIVLDSERTLDRSL